VNPPPPFLKIIENPSYPVAVYTLATYPEMNNPIKMEVGIEECLHIEFEYNKSKYHLKVTHRQI
jgi:hypothetical protein